MCYVSNVCKLFDFALLLLLRDKLNVTKVWLRSSNINGVLSLIMVYVLYSTSEHNNKVVVYFYY